MPDEWQALVDQLRHRGVAGSEEFGRFVNDTGCFPPSQFDERAAMPVLLDAIPTLTDPKVIGAAAAHLRRPWARPAAFETLAAAFEAWAAVAPGAGWQLGDALASTATTANAGRVMQLARDRRYGNARQMIVYALWRFRRVEGVVDTIVDLTVDEDVALHAMMSLRRAIGSIEALPHLERVRAEYPGTPLAEQANRQIKKIRRTIAAAEVAPTRS